jgi:agmatinase
MPEDQRPAPRGPLDALKVPRFAGPATFARLPTLEEVGRCDVAIVGIPFDTGVTYRPGARFGPSAIRQGSRLLRAYDPSLDVEPFFLQQVVDAGDVACTPFHIQEALAQIQAAVSELLRAREGEPARRLIALGGDHTVALPMLRAVRERFGPVALIHFDAHLDTWGSYFGAAYTHGTPFSRAAEEGLLAPDRSVHVGLRGPTFSRADFPRDSDLGFRQIDTAAVAEQGVSEIAGQVRERVGDAPVYVSVDIDVLDPAHAPGTGTPEAGGLTTRELLSLLRNLVGLPIVSADVVEVAPAYDHAEITAIAAAHVVYELLGLMALDPAAGSPPTS